MVDQLRFMQDFIRLRWNQPALRGPMVNPFHTHNVNRVLAFHRCNEWQGLDVVVVASLNDQPFFNYQLGFPRGGHWLNSINSDVYDNWVNPLAVGNYGGVDASGGPMHGLPVSAWIAIPPRSLVVFGMYIQELDRDVYPVRPATWRRKRPRPAWGRRNRLSQTSL